jgi:hypothetical protein
MRLQLVEHKKNIENENDLSVPVPVPSFSKHSCLMSEGGSELELVEMEMLKRNPLKTITWFMRTSRILLMLSNEDMGSRKE